MSPGDAAASIRDLDEVAPGDGGIVGNKALRQGLLLQAGFPVSPGFVLTTPAIAAWNAGGAARDAVQAALLDAYRRLGGRVAVRSSAIEEDGHGASYAGIYASELAVSGETALLAAVGRCLASWSAPAAVDYRRQLGDVDGALAILVQQLVPAIAAGIAYTRAPLDDSRREVHIDAVWGLAEPLAAGRVDGDSFVLSHGGRLLRRRVVDKHHALAADGVHTVRPQRVQVACLTPAQARDVARLALRAEAHFGSPQDIEFAIDARAAWIVQSRPLVAARHAGGAALERFLAGERRRLARKAVQLRRRGVLHGRELVLSNGNIGELLPTPTVMSFGVFRGLFAGRDGAIVRGRARLGYRFEARRVDHLYELVAGQACFNLEVDAATFDDGSAPDFEDYLARVEADPSLANYPEIRLYSQHQVRGAEAPARAAFRRGMHAAARDFLQRFGDEIAPRLVVPAKLAAEAAEAADAQAAAAAVPRLMRFLRGGPCVDFVIAARLGFYFAAAVRAQLVHRLGADGEALCARLLSGLPASLVTRQALWIEELAHGHRSPAAYLEAYGHCADNELELSEPRLSEQPARLAALLADFAASGRRPAAEFARQQAERAATEDALPRLLGAAGMADEERAEFLDALRFAQQLLPLRETIKHRYTAAYALIRRHVLRLAADLGWPEGLIFHLYPRELAATLRDPARLRRRAERRAEAHAMARLAARLRCVPDVVFGSRLDAIGAAAASSGDVAGQGWCGAPLAPGRAFGIARVLEAGERLPDGGWRGDEILVLRAANLGVTPLFRVVAGVVVEVGGLLAHSACQAREAGIPAVALSDATRLIADGARIVIDGATGRVAPAPPHRDGIDKECEDGRRLSTV